MLICPVCNTNITSTSASTWTCANKLCHNHGRDMSITEATLPSTLNNCICGNYYIGSSCGICGREALEDLTCTKVLYLTKSQASTLSTLLNIDLRHCGAEYREDMNPVFKQLAGRDHDSVEDLP